MTYWFHAYCPVCKIASPPLFCTSFGKISLYILDDAGKELAGDWLFEHDTHDPIIASESTEDRFPPMNKNWKPDESYGVGGYPPAPKLPDYREAK